MEKIKEISKMCDAEVKLTWPGFTELADGGKCSKLKEKLKKKKKKKKKKGKKKKGEEEEPEEEDAAAAEEGLESNKKRKLECEACTRGAAPSNVRRAALWCCTRCALMFCGAMRMFVAAAGVLGLCLTMFFIFAPNGDEPARS